MTTLTRWAVPAVAPMMRLKLAALEGCKDLAALVNDHIVNFRRHDMEELKRRKADLNYRGYDVDSLNPGVVGVKGDDGLDPHGDKLLQGHGTV